ncbi:hypothetical protein CW745_15420 [Psychromonas sp. psych-6C06]|uniref:hypothetical protein n=1 Tax=Psychromonas sp. psych-6C06 TaxID=2058089 RepID=UPI000C31CB47|nr:hypothetical protein [Psychromonas sp. psych-6C06]PKF60333.1 hypothetical protein CW745_15420 [Psychromonas sp. psych-6C06]
MLNQRNKRKKNLVNAFLLFTYVFVVIILGVAWGGTAQLILTLIAVIGTFALLMYGHGIKGSFANANAQEKKALERVAIVKGVKWAGGYSLVLLFSYWIIN